MTYNILTYFYKNMIKLKYIFSLKDFKNHSFWLIIKIFFCKNQINDYLNKHLLNNAIIYLEKEQ